MHYQPDIFSPLIASLAAVSCLGAADALPVALTLDRPGFVTAVIEDAAGNRVCNLASEVKANAGKLTLNWDFYDVGLQPGTQRITVGGHEVEELLPYTRHLVKPGTYTVRGLVHQGITLGYDLSVYSPGVPPWKTQDMSGTWMGDHAAPSDCLFLPSGPNGKPTMLLATSCAEAGHALSYCDLDGRKYKGVNSDNFNGGKAVAVDVAPGGDTRVYFVNQVGLNTINDQGRHEVVVKLSAPLKPFPVFDEYGFLDLAIWHGFAVVSNSDNHDNVTDPPQGNLRLINLGTKTELANLKTQGFSRGVEFSPDGKLFALIGSSVVRFHIDSTKGELVREAEVITGLVAPRRLCRDGSGNFYISELGNLHVIKVFDQAGKPLRTIGKPGGGQLGPYDEQRMDRPDGMAITAQGKLWVAENSTLPKRISIWDAKTGAFERAIYGGPQYGGGGTIDPSDSTLFYYPHNSSAADKGTMVFKLDWQTGASKPLCILARTPLCGRRTAQSWDNWNKVDATTPEEPEKIYHPFDNAFNSRLCPAPHLAVQAGGHHYVFNRAYRADQPTHTVLWRWDAAKDAYAVPVAMIGDCSAMFRQGGSGIFDKATHHAAIRAAHEAAAANGFVWSDRNGDHFVTADEIQFFRITAKQPQLGGLFGQYLNPDLSFAAFHLECGLFAAPTIDTNGVPHWDLSKHTPLGFADPTRHNRQPMQPLIGSEFNVFGAQGWEFMSNPAGFRKDGTPAWTYRYYQITQVPQFPGQLIAGVGGMGRVVKPSAGQAGEIWATSSEKGQAYLFTTDGLFLKTLGGDVRTTPLWRFPTAKRGMTVDGVSWEDECFYPTINQTATGDIYIVTGKEHISLLKLNGLDKVQRTSWGTITVTPAMLAGLPATVEEAVPKQARKILEVTLGGTAPIVDGNAADWSTVGAGHVARIDQRTTASLHIADSRIFAVFRTGDAKLLDNSAADPRFLFKFGGALDLCLGAKWDPGNIQENNPYQEGDCRVLIAKVKNKPVAMLYRPVDSSAAKSAECVFASPIGTEVFAAVTDITSAMQFAEDGQGTYEFSFPLAAILRHKVGQNGKWQPVTMQTLGKQDWHEDKTVILGDVGIIRGNGQQNVQRVCWNNLDTWMTSDIPSEARWRSLNFGLFTLVAP